MSYRPTAFIKFEDGELVDIPFDKCVLDVLGWPDKISYKADGQGNIILLKDEAHAEIPLKHSDYCPVNPSGECEMMTPKGVNKFHVGVVVFLMSSDNYVLLTRRSKHLKLFPGLWVLPGGHVDEGEKFIETAVRELSEETGIQLSHQEYQAKEMFIFESCYPPFREDGPIKRRHLIVVFDIRSTLPLDELQKQVDLHEHETDSCVWVHASGFHDIIHKNHLDHLKISEQYTKVDGVVKYGRFDTRLFARNIYDTMTDKEKPIQERLSTATFTALKVFLDQKPP